MEETIKTQTKSMRLDVELIDKIENMAKEQNRNFTNMVETILKTATMAQ